MMEIGLIDPERLKSIPRKYWAHHEFCFHLHDLMVQLLKKIDDQRLSFISFKIESEDDRKQLADGTHILDFLAKSGRGDLERRAVVNHVSCSVYADMLHFIYEGLRALEKRKFTVALALLRKPFKESLLIAARMCADEVAFFDKLKSDAKNLLNLRELGEGGIKALLAQALEQCSVGVEFTNAEVLYETVFNRGNELGLAGLFDKATHLITDYTKIRTENYDLNFIFKDHEDDDIYEGGTYALIATILLFLNVMQLELYSRMHAASPTYKDWMLVTSLGAHEALFVPEGNRLTSFVNEHFKELLKCPNCDAELGVTRAAAPRFFIAEMIDCTHCADAYHFPFGWLLSKLDLKLGSRGREPPSSPSDEPSETLAPS